MTSRPRPNFRLTRPLFIREANASFAHSLMSSATRGKSAQVLEEKLLQLGVTSRRVLVYLLVKWCTTLPSEGVEEDLLFSLWYIYIEEFFVGFLLRPEIDILITLFFSSPIPFWTYLKLE